MILDETRSKAVTSRTDAVPIDTESDAQRKLETVFGEHTFFRSEEGVFIVEPTSDPARPNRKKLVKRIPLATWTDSEHKTLKPIKAKRGAKKIEI